MTTRRSIPMCDLRAQYFAIQPEIDAALHAVLQSGEYERSEHLWDFEAQFARACQRTYAIGVGSGLSALFLALKALGIHAEDEVITVPNTDISTCAAIGHCGATIVWVDIDPGTHNMDLRRVEERITTRTRAIVPVSLYGLPADLMRLQELATAYGVALISDAALAFGATLEGRPVGAFGDLACFSFAPTKVLGAYGDGGMVVTDDPDLAVRVRRLAGYGEPDPRGMADAAGSIHLDTQGYHQHLDVLQAAVLMAKLPHVPEWVRRRNAIALRYKAQLEPYSLRLQEVAHGLTHAYRSFVVEVPDPPAALAWLRSRSIASQRLYAPPLHLQPVYAHRGIHRGAFPVAESLADSLLCLPMYPELGDADVDFIASELGAYVSSRGQSG
jgi:dTDP-4-amino-4,6-dideoxygalactose transaminase